MKNQLPYGADRKEANASRTSRIMGYAKGGRVEGDTSIQITVGAPEKPAVVTPPAAPPMPPRPPTPPMGMSPPGMGPKPLGMKLGGRTRDQNCD